MYVVSVEFFESYAEFRAESSVDLVPLTSSQRPDPGLQNGRRDLRTSTDDLGVSSIFVLEDP